MLDEPSDFRSPSLTEERSHPNHWYNKAADLRAAAGAIWHAMETDVEGKVAQSLGLPRGYSMGIACWHVYHMLCGLALEVIMKAIMAQRGLKVPATHNLSNLAGMLKIKLSSHERNLLKFYSSTLIWAGRYPTPKECSDDALRAFYDEANSVLRKPLKKVGSLTITVGTDATDWGNFHPLWLRLANEFEFR